MQKGNFVKMRVSIFRRSRSVSLPGSSGGTLAAGGKRSNPLAKQQKNTIAKQKLRKNACSIFHEVKVRDLVAVQRRDAGRAEHEILKNKKKHEGNLPSYFPAGLPLLHPAGLPDFFI